VSLTPVYQVPTGIPSLWPTSDVKRSAVAGTLEELSEVSKIY